MRSLLVAALSLCVAVAHAQTSSTAPLSGTVMDPTGAFVPAAKVTVRNEATGSVYTTLTETNGTFTVPSLPSGNYTVTVSAAGFKQQQVMNVKMDVGVPTNIEVRVEVGAQTETITVNGTPLVFNGPLKTSGLSAAMPGTL